jgi:uncharacterized membrane protein YhaH (DUF805 family)
MDLSYLYTSLDGRINRAKYWAAVIILAVVVIALQWIAIAGLGSNFAGRLVYSIVGWFSLYPFYAVAAKRFQDRDKPALYALVGPAILLLYFVLVLFGVVGPGEPNQFGALDWIFGTAHLVVGIWYLIELGILKGTTGANQYGPDPLGAS